MLAATAALAAFVLAACAQAPATTRFNETQAQPGDVQVVQATVVPGGALLGTVEVWLSQHGIMFWTPWLAEAGTYDFEVVNRGSGFHDFTITRARSIAEIPTRSDRALLQNVEVLVRSKVLAPGERIMIRASLEQSGSYVVLSSQDTDFGSGMATVLQVGAEAGPGAARPTPEPTPRPDDRATVAVYLADSAVFLHNREVNAGVVTLRVQNLGPSLHNVVVVQWRGDPAALPVDEDDELLLDGLTVVGELPPIPPGGTEMLEVELDEDYAYVVLSSLPGDYAAGMASQLVPR